MDVTGCWKVCRTKVFTDEFKMVWKDAGELLSDEDTEESRKLSLRAKIIFGADGFFRVVMPVPEDISPEYLDEAIESGEIKLYDGGILFSELPYRVDGDKVFYKIPAQDGSFSDDAASWTEFPQKDGKLQFMDHLLCRS